MGAALVHPPKSVVFSLSFWWKKKHRALEAMSRGQR